MTPLAPGANRDGSTRLAGGQAFEPDVRPESLTYVSTTGPRATSRLRSRSNVAPNARLLISHSARAGQGCQWRVNRVNSLRNCRVIPAQSEEFPR